MYNVGIFLFDDIELLDFTGPYEAFSVASRMNRDKLFSIFTISQECKEIKTINGLKVLTDFTFENHPNIDILIIPGGMGTKEEIKKKEVLKWISKNNTTSKITMSVCSGARLLAKIGLLDGIESTTHHGVLEDLRKIAPKTIINSEKRFTGKDKLFTAAGISAGIDLSLHIIDSLYGKEVVNRTIVYMEYNNWKKLQ